MKCDTRRFALLGTKRLSDDDEGVRRLAAALLEKIGTERDTPPLIALLSDEEVTVQHQAAKALVAIGGTRDLIAMDAWLKKGTGGNRHVESLRHVKECRDALELRLNESPMPKNLKD
jgi:HEAT repeat protein